MGKPVKALTEDKRKTGGRNKHGPRFTSRGIAGGHKQKYRFIDFKRRKWDMPATVERLEYDPNRTAFIALVKYEDGKQAYIPAPQRLAVGDKIVAGNKIDVKPGNAMAFSSMPVGTIVHNIELKPGKGGQIARSAGTYAQFVGRDGGYAQIRVSSGELRLVRRESWPPSAPCRIPTIEPESRQGRSRPSQGQPPERARRREEPDRSPAWRW